jgi:hypothetical protein
VIARKLATDGRIGRPGSQEMAVGTLHKLMKWFINPSTADQARLILANFFKRGLN